MHDTKIRSLVVLTAFLVVGCQKSNSVNRLLGLEKENPPAADLLETQNADKSASAIRMKMTGLVDDGFGNKSEISFSAKIRIKDGVAEMVGESQMYSLQISARTEQSEAPAGASSKGRGRVEERGRNSRGWPATVLGQGVAVEADRHLKVDFSEIIFRLPKHPFHLSTKHTDENGNRYLINSVWKNNVLTQTYTDAEGINHNAVITCQEDGCPTRYLGQLQVAYGQARMIMTGQDGTRIELSGEAR